MDSGDRQASEQVGLGASWRGTATLPERVHRAAKKVGDRENLRVDHTQPRRMSRDYEFLAETTEALIYVAMIRLMVRRLAKGVV
jgi:transposase